MVFLDFFLNTAFFQFCPYNVYFRVNIYVTHSQVFLEAGIMLLQFTNVILQRKIPAEVGE